MKSVKKRQVDAIISSLFGIESAVVECVYVFDGWCYGAVVYEMLIDICVEGMIDRAMKCIV